MNNEKRPTAPTKEELKRWRVDAEGAFCEFDESVVHGGLFPEDQRRIVTALEESRSRVEELTEALQFYATEDHYEERVTFSGIRKPGVLQDRGAKARDALEGKGEK